MQKLPLALILALLGAKPMSAAAEQDQGDDQIQTSSPAQEVLATAKKEPINPNAFRDTFGYSLGVGGIGSVWGLNYNYMAFQLKDGSGLNLRFSTRMNFGSFAHIKDGFFDPIWYNGMHFLWQSRPISNRFRFYGGGGVWYGWRPSPKDDPRNCYLPTGKCSELDKPGKISGGGFTGIEFFDKRRSYFVEIGAQGAAHPNRMDGGLFLHAGSNFFL